jgi:LPS-assembly protein
MKNNLIVLTVCFLFFFNITKSSAFNFETKTLKIIKEKNLVIASEGKAYLSGSDLEIRADRFEYKKDLGILESNGNGLLIIKSKNIKIKFDKSTYDQKNSTLIAEGNIEINEFNKNIYIETQEIFYDKKNNFISSSTKTLLKDNFQNSYLVKSFNFDIEKNILKLIDLEFIDKEENILKTKIAFMNTKSGKLFGKDISIDLNNSSFNEGNEPRLKGNSLINETNTTKITKGSFTSCKKRDGCPPWKITAKKITHDKKKREIVYDDAFLEVYDVPVVYFPKFFHPDPTVKRRSGFLVPSISNSSNSDNYLNIPYFFAIADNKDMTFSPRFYPDEKILLQTEFRQVGLKSNHFADFSFFGERKKSSKNHFFYKYDKSLKVGNFDSSKLDLFLQNTSSDTYLKSEKLENKVFKDNDVLENSINLDLYSDDLSLSFNSTVYEDLNKTNNDRYEYILPKVELIKNMNEIVNLNGDLQLQSQAFIRHYDTDIYEKINVNNFDFNSNARINRYGFFNNHEFLIKNSNTDNKNSSYKNKENFYLSGVYQFNSNLPLIKNNENYQKILKPKISLRVAPNHSKNDVNSERKIDLNNVYSLNRTVDNQSIEGGMSAIYGIDYSIINKKQNNELFNFKLANNLRIEENDDLSNMNQIGQKVSNIFNEVEYKPNEFFNTKYASAIKNNLRDKSYESLKTEFKVNNFITTFDYLNENNTLKKNSYLSNETSININKFNSFGFSTRKNKTTNLTEYYNLLYQYENDCLVASVEYNKDFYSDREIRPDESIFFKLTFIPFGEASSPNLKN